MARAWAGKGKAGIEGEKEDAAGRQRVAESRLASFLRNSARQSGEKLVLPSVGSGRCEGFVQGAAVWNTRVGYTL